MARHPTPLGPTLRRLRAEHHRCQLVVAQAKADAHAAAGALLDAERSELAARHALEAEIDRQTHPAQTDDRFVTVREAADYTHLARQTLYRMAERGELRTSYVGRSVRLWWPDVVSLMADGRAS